MATTPLASGTSFPVSPSDGDWFLRTDQNITYFYNNSLSRWLSTDLKYMALAQQGVLNGGTTATNTLGYMPVWTDLYIENFVNTIFVNTTNDGTHFYGLQLNKINAANSSTNIASFDTSADTVANWTTHTVAVNALVLVANHKVLQAFLATKTSTPGACVWTTGITARFAG